MRCECTDPGCPDYDYEMREYRDLILGEFDWYIPFSDTTQSKETTDDIL